MNKKHWAVNRNNYKVHQTIESYLEWFENEYPEPKRKNKNKDKDNKYFFKIEFKEIILSFD